MKKTILFSILFFAAEAVFSQKIILHRNSGGDQILYSSSIDSITFLPFACSDEIRYMGKTYHTVLIGTQCWMKENLDVGTLILGNLDQTNNAIIEKYCYNNDTANCNIYGGLYQWNEMMQYITTPGTRGICPAGWHIPTLSEFQTLAAAVGYDGNALKAIGQGSFEGQGTNTSGFSALLAGYRDYYGNFCPLGDYAFFWSSTAYNANYAHQLYLVEMQSNIYMYNSLKAYGHSVRCLKD